MMKKLLTVVLLAFVSNVAMISPAYSADSDNGAVVVKKEEKSAFKGFFYKVWGKLRAISPTAATNTKRSSVATAGVRGAETTTSIISPYWKDDNTQDEDYVKELAEFTRAQQLAEEGDLEAAVDALSSFINTYDKSDYRANAQFALGVSYGGLGKTAESVSAFQDFVNDNPKHPLVDDAKQVISELR